jgi:uncharacterized protein YhhL (DUF1145 family)
MEMILAFLWFAAGAVLALLLKNIIYFHEQRKIVVALVTHFVVLIERLKLEIKKGYQLKHKALEESDIDKKDLDTIKELDNNVADNWEVFSVAIMMSCLPDKYRMYLQESLSKNFKERDK